MFLLRSRMFSPSQAEVGEAGVARHDVPVPPSTTSSLSGGRGNAGRQAFKQQQGNGCQVPGFPSGFQVVVLKACREELTG